MVAKANRLQEVKEYYFSHKLREVSTLVSQGKPIVNIGIGSPDLEPPLEVVNALQQSLGMSKAHAYQSYQGTPELRNAIAGFYSKNFNVSLDESSEVLPLMGSKEGIMHISMAFLNHGDEVLIPNPGYPTYTSVTKLVGATPVYYDLKEETDWLPDFEALEQQDLTKVKLMWINYPHMPTGTAPTEILFERLISFAKKHQILLVNDNPYSFILNESPKSMLSVEGAKEVAIELNSLSKTFNMAGWRVGMLLGAEKYLKSVLQVKSNMDSGMFLGIQKGAVAALNLPNAWYDEINETYSRRRAIVWGILEALECSFDKEKTGLFVWAKLPEGMTSEQMTDELLYEKDIFITPGTVFGSNGEGYVRLSLCVEESALQEVLKRVSLVKVN